ncbi:cupin domain-containing protein [Pedobacter mendelii]|uniref:Cupin type-2 domain-containing protein n=1 Tax=Pedobacter mendelii TaxID=1908240 RepID=A0ABQ2BM05_9SPHI|nr:cupin domain-containing protein [Pedobacter mendelii]GGI29123.1 hypothetical protein GCM10008119_36070 [Pedobacter mendelii]
MKSVVEIIESGLLELYVLNLLEVDEICEVEKLRLIYPEIKEEIDKIEIFLEKHAMENSLLTSSEIDRKMDSLFFEINKQLNLDLKNLPLIEANSNYKIWLNSLKELMPKDLIQDKFTHLLTSSEKTMQMLVISEIDIEEEIHENELESFLILEGTCVCTIDNEEFNMFPGDFMAIPLHKPHTVKITSPRVTAILQHLTV